VPLEQKRSPLRTATDPVLGLKNTSDAALHGKAKLDRAMRRAARKRRNQPHGPLEAIMERALSGAE
jgi:hypothetical protein